MLSNARNILDIENAGITFTSVTQLRDIFAQRLNITKKCTHPSTECWHDTGIVKTLPLSDGTQYTANDFSSNTNTSSILLSDGTLLLFFRDNDTVGWIMADVNGFKGPNVYGKDIFATRINSKQIYPFSEAEMGTCNPVAAGIAGNAYIGISCSADYLLK